MELDYLHPLNNANKSLMFKEIGSRTLSVVFNTYTNYVTVKVTPHTHTQTVSMPLQTDRHNVLVRLGTIMFVSPNH